MRTSLHQEIALDAAPQRVFNILMDSKQFAAFTGMPATIDSIAGGAFTTFGGLIQGRNVELIPGQRIVQAWRPTSWDPGVYSIVHFELKNAGGGTTLALDHTGFPEGDFDHLDPGWYMRYWNPLKKYLADIASYGNYFSSLHTEIGMAQGAHSAVRLRCLLPQSAAKSQPWSASLPSFH